MADLEKALEDCLARLDRGESVAACLERYPEQADELRPLLLAAAKVEDLRALRPSPTFRAQGRERLGAHMRAHPRQPAEPEGLVAAVQNWWSGVLSSFQSFDRRMAYGLAAMAFVFLTAFTAFAQTALPGQPLYGWKLASESGWRLFQGDKLDADLALLDRRAAEIVEVAGDPPALMRAKTVYQQILERALAGASPAEQAEVAGALQDHWQEFASLDIDLPLLENLLSGEGLLPALPTPLPGLTGTPLPLEATTIPSPSTLLPAVTPTLDLDLPLGTATESGAAAGSPTPEATPTPLLPLPTPSEEILPTLPSTLLPTATPSDLLTPTIPDPLPTATLPDLAPTPTIPELLPTATLLDPVPTLPSDPLPSTTPLLDPLSP